MDMNKKLTGALTGTMMAIAMLITQPAFADHTLTIDGAPGPGNPLVTSWSEQGFTFTSTHMHTVTDPTICSFGGCIANGTNYLTSEASLGGSITLTSSSAAFDLYQFDGGETFNDASAAAAAGDPNATQIKLVGTKVGGATITALFNLDGFANGGLGPISDFQNFITTGFTNLTSVTFSGISATGAQGGFSLEDIKVHPVPEPSTYLLFGAGLALLGLMRRRKTVA